MSERIEDVLRAMEWSRTQLALAACACVRTVWDLADPLARKAIEITEAHIMRVKRPPSIDQVVSAADAAYAYGITEPVRYAAYCAASCVSPRFNFPLGPATYAAWYALKGRVTAGGDPLVVESKMIEAVKKCVRC